jgi:hypothetical protein
MIFDIHSRKDLNNNRTSAKLSKSPEVNDDDDVETVQTADIGSLVPDSNGVHDFASDPNETENVS